jgi:hyperosmotically inducible periplasmic protein
MKSTFRALTIGLLFIPLALVSPGTGLYAATNTTKAAPQGQRDPARLQATLVQEVRHQLVMLPWYTLFDNLEYKVEGDKVLLVGQVVRPVLKSDAEAAVKRIEGVASVDNQIEVLPLSPNDDRIRRAEFRAIYGFSSLQRYAQGAVPPIHIIVKNGHVTLEGVVDNEADKELAYVQANGVPDVFSVTDNLRVANSGK